MRYFELLLEYNLQSLVNTLGRRLMAKWEQEGKPYSDQITEETPQAIINWMEQFDPTQNKSYMTWIVAKYAGKKGGIDRLEDIASRLNDHLNRYERLKRKHLLKSEHKNINNIKTLVDLSNIVKQYKDEEASSQGEATELTNKNVEVVYDGVDYSVKIPKTFETSKELCGDADWCTAYPNEYERYSTQGPLYVITNKEWPFHKFQFHFESEQYMDHYDNDLDMNAFSQQHKKLLNVIIKHYGGMEKAAITDPKTWFSFVKNPSEEMKLAAVKKDRYAIEYIKNPSEEVQMVAVKEDGYAIKYIKNPTLEVQIAAVKQTGYAIAYIKNPSEEVQMVAVKNNGSAIRKLNNPSWEVQMAAVEQFPPAIEYIKNPTPEIQLAAN